MRKEVESTLDKFRHEMKNQVNVVEQLNKNSEAGMFKLRSYQAGLTEVIDQIILRVDQVEKDQIDVKNQVLTQQKEFITIFSKLSNIASQLGGGESRTETILE